VPIYPNFYQTLSACPIVELRGYAAACGLKGRLYAYLDFAGPTGTARDGLAEGMLDLAIEKKKLISGQPIIEAASGPFAAALTLAGLTAGHPVVLVMPEDAPALRQESFLARKREYLRNVESLIGLKRGILGEVEAAQRTATEVTSSQGDYSLTIQDLQQMWEAAVRCTVVLCGKLGKLYRVPGAFEPDPERAVCIDWGNGVLYDKDKEWAETMQLVSAGMLKPEIALAWKYGLPWETASDLQKVREKYMPELESMLE